MFDSLVAECDIGKRLFVNGFGYLILDVKAGRYFNNTDKELGKVMLVVGRRMI